MDLPGFSSLRGLGLSCGQMEGQDVRFRPQWHQLVPLGNAALGLVYPPGSGQVLPVNAKG